MARLFTSGLLTAINTDSDMIGTKSNATIKARRQQVARRGCHYVSTATLNPYSETLV
jgi:hypothetical protein